MKKLLMLIGALIMSNAYGETVWWYVNDNDVRANSCSTGGNITVPATPSHPTNPNNYRFIGWSDTGKTFDSLPLSGIVAINADSYTTSSTYLYLTFPYGQLTFQSRCSSTSASSCYSNPANCATTTNPSLSGTKRYCWCQLTNKGPLASKITVSPLPFVFYGDASTETNCSATCATNCAATIKPSTDFRKKLFGL